MVCGNAVAAVNEAIQADKEAAEKAAASQGAYFSDQANAPEEAPAPAPAAEGQPVYAQPALTPDGQPAFAQAVYTQPGAQQVYGQPVYTQPDGQPVYAQPVFIQPDGQTVYAQPVYTQPDGQPVYAQPVYGQPMYAQAAGPMNPIAAALAQSTLIMGIIAVCLGFTWFLSPGGIVLGAIALSKSNEYLNQFGPLPTKAKVGRHLGRAGLIGGIVVTVFCLICIFAYIVDQM